MKTKRELQQYIETNCEFIPWTGCWIWLGHLRVNRGNQQRGSIRYNNKRYIVSRLAFEIYRGPILSGKLVLHTCDVAICCNPAHLYLGTHLDNARDRDKRGRNGLKGKTGLLCHNTKLTEADKNEIIKLRNRRVKLFSIAKKYNIAVGTVSKICLPVCGHFYGNAKC